MVNSLSSVACRIYLLLKNPEGMTEQIIVDGLFGWEYVATLWLEDETGIVDRNIHPHPRVRNPIDSPLFN